MLMALWWLLEHHGTVTQVLRLDGDARSSVCEMRKVGVGRRGCHGARCGRGAGALQHITADPDRTTEITRAALILTQFEHEYIS